MQWSTYYQKLTPKRKKAFVVRTLVFKRTTKFTARKGHKVISKMEYLISSAFVQLTFGISIDELGHFNHVHVTPRSYSYSWTDREFDGDVNPMLFRVNFSWPAIKRGFETPNDGLNLALHEFAHCLMLEHDRSYTFAPILSDAVLDGWDSLKVNILKRIRSGDRGPFREYAGTNFHELFATSIECFFERPHELYSFDKQYYRVFVWLLNQDPRNESDPLKVNRSPISR